MLPIGRRALCAAAAAAAASARAGTVGRASAAGARLAPEAAFARAAADGSAAPRPFSARGYSSKRKKKPAIERKRLLVDEGKAGAGKEVEAEVAAAEVEARAGATIDAAASTRDTTSGLSAARLDAISRAASKVLGGAGPKVPPKSTSRFGRPPAGRGRTSKAADKVPERVPDKVAKPEPEPSAMTRAAMQPKVEAPATKTFEGGAKAPEPAAKAPEPAAKAPERAAKAPEPAAKAPERAAKTPAKDEAKVATAAPAAAGGASGTAAAAASKAAPKAAGAPAPPVAPKAAGAPAPPAAPKAGVPPVPPASGAPSSGFAFGRSIALWTVGGGVLYLVATTDDLPGSTKTAGLVSVRILRDARAFVLTCADYWWSLRGLEEGSPELEEAAAACHRRGAQRLLDLCVSNGGTYVKMGQHVGMMDHVIPDAYVDLLRARLLDRCPASPFPHVRAAVERELGRPLEEVFEVFEEEPLASASLAQVHRAVLRERVSFDAPDAVEDSAKGMAGEGAAAAAADAQVAADAGAAAPAAADRQTPLARARAVAAGALRGASRALGAVRLRLAARGGAAEAKAEAEIAAPASREVAVKIQHAGLADSLDADVAVVRALVHLAGYLFPSFQMDWLVLEIDQSMRQELDFLREADNLERCAADLRSERVRGVFAPRVYRSLSTPKLLTMEFVRGVGASDREALARLGVSPADVAARLRAAFDVMAFRTGWLHCDPHPANLRVVRLDGREDPTAAGEPLPRAGRSGWALALLDHGQYRELSPELRRAWAGLWHGLVVADQDEVERSARGLGAGDKAKLFVSVITRAAYDELFGEQAAAKGGQSGADAAEPEAFGRAVLSEVAAQRAEEEAEKQDKAGVAGVASAASASASTATSAKSFASRLLSPFSSAIPPPSARLQRREDDPARRARLAAFARAQAGEIAEMLGELPRPVLLLLKTNECLRAVDRELGQPATSMLATARDAARALADDRAKEQGRWATLLDRSRVEVRLALFAAALKIRGGWDWLFGNRA